MNKKIVVESLARVEGHGGIDVEIENRKVKDVKVNIYEGPRLIESIVVGRTPEEDLNITPRICAICTFSHRYAAIRGLEKSLGIEVSKKTQLLRDLMHCGEMIESHSLHVFILALPDFLGYPSAVAMLSEYPEEVKNALELKKFGNMIMETISGRMIHGENPVIGGFGRFPEKDELLAIKKKAQELLPVAERGVDLIRNLEYPTFMEDGMVFMALKPPTDEYGFWGDRVMISTGEDRDVEEYRKLTNERVVPHSYAKRSRYKKRPFVVGAIARMNLLGERLKGIAGECFKKSYTLSWIRNPLYNNLAQAIEIVYCLEKIPYIIDEILKIQDTPGIVPPARDTGKGTGAVEAPRGTLYHYYEIENGIIKFAEIITPTAQNLDNMERHVKVGAETLLNEEFSEEEIRSKLEMIVRAYDPCISCSAHLVRIKKVNS